VILVTLRSWNSMTTMSRRALMRNNRRAKRRNESNLERTRLRRAFLIFSSCLFQHLRWPRLTIGPKLQHGLLQNAVGWIASAWRCFIDRLCIISFIIVLIFYLIVAFLDFCKKYLPFLDTEFACLKTNASCKGVSIIM